MILQKSFKYGAQQSSKELFICFIINAFKVTFDQFNASLLIKVLFRKMYQQQKNSLTPLLMIGNVYVTRKLIVYLTSKRG